MTPDERQILFDAAALISKVRNALVCRRNYNDIRILERTINELADVLENDMDRKQKEEEKENIDLND